MFDERYNNSLWMMLAGEKAGKETIARMIKMIPNELFVEIETMVKMYLSTGLYEPVSYNGTLDGTNDRISVSASISENEQLCLFLRKVPAVEEDFILEEYCLELCPVDMFEVSDMKSNAYLNLGRVMHLRRRCRDVLNMDVENGELQISFDKTYSCTRNILGNFVHVNTESKVRPLGVYEDYSLIASKRVNVDRVPTKMYPHQFKDERRLNRLVKGRKK